MQREPLVDLPAEIARPQRVEAARYVLGVDGGATKTLAAVLDLQTSRINLGHGGPSNQDAVGSAAAVQALLSAAEKAIAGAAIDPGDLSAAVLAVAGTDTAAIAAHVERAGRGAWTVVNDVVGAWATATDAGPGVGVISGTGSNVFGVGRDGGGWRAGGWGHIVGDEGSGYWIGVESIKAALRDREASGPPTAISDELPGFFGKTSVEEAAQWVYAKPLTKGEIAAFAVRTSALAEAGDEVACEIYERAAAELTRQIAAVLSRTGLSGEFPVGLIGSAFKAGAVFVDPVTAAIHRESPQARVAVVEMAPVGGALLLAARACGHADDIPGETLAPLVEAAIAVAPAGGHSSTGG